MLGAMPTHLRTGTPTRNTDIDEFLRSGGAGTTVTVYQPRDVLFSQGDPSDSVMYLREGAVKLSVLSASGQEAIVAILETGAFFGESALVGAPVRHETASAMTTATVMVIPKQPMTHLLHGQDEFFDRFMAHVLVRNIRLEEDLVDQLFNSSEKRLARALLLLAQYDQRSKTQRVRHQITQQALADMVGTTRSRVNFFLNKFKKRGYIEYRGGLQVNESLRTVFLRNEPAQTGLLQSA